MLRAGSNPRAMEALIRTHHNCLLKTDRIRFKKSSQTMSNWPNKLATLRKGKASSSQQSDSLDSSSMESAEQQQEQNQNDALYYNNKNNKDYAGSPSPSKGIAIGKIGVITPTGLRIIGWYRLGDGNNKPFVHLTAATAAPFNRLTSFAERPNNPIYLSLRSNFKDTNNKGQMSKLRIGSYENEVK